MNNEVKIKWLEALRSGDYDQGQGGLKSGDNKFCCLGILCDIFLKEHNENWQKPIRDENFFSIDGVNNCLPKRVSEWAEIDTVWPKVMTSATNSEYLTSLNDGNNLINIRQHSFLEIANLIEASL